MTREEAICCLSVHSSTNGSGLCTDEQHYEAKQLAIKALEQEPCNDCVSREKVWSMITSGKYPNENDEQFIDRLVEELEKMPSVTPTQNWIPVSERLPEDGTWNIFTDGKNVSVERYKSDAIDHFNPNGRWFSLEEAVAWMPLPQPYTAESEEV